jgi:hypothetical protein
MACLKCNKEYEVFTDEFTGEVDIYPVDEMFCLSCEKELDSIDYQSFNDDSEMLLQRGGK